MCRHLLSYCIVHNAVGKMGVVNNGWIGAFYIYIFLINCSFGNKVSLVILYTDCISTVVGLWMNDVPTPHASSSLSFFLLFLSLFSFCFVIVIVSVSVTVVVVVIVIVVIVVVVVAVTIVADVVIVFV